MKTPIVQPKTSMSGQALALISQAVPDRDIYKLLVEGMEYELRAAEQRGIESTVIYSVAHQAGWNRVINAAAEAALAVEPDGGTHLGTMLACEVAPAIMALAQGGGKV